MKHSEPEFFSGHFPIFHSFITQRQCLTTFGNTSEFVKNTPLQVIFSTLFSEFKNVVKHRLSCLIYYTTYLKLGKLSAV